MNDDDIILDVDAGPGATPEQIEQNIELLNTEGGEGFG